jgi:hypothetical protein
MPRLKCVISAVLFCAAIVFFATSANADTTYTYTGQQLTDVERLGCLPTPCLNFPGTFFIDGFFTVATPLAANLNDAPVNFINFAFSSEGLTDNLAEEEAEAAEPGGGPFPSPGGFNVSTNASGQIDKWLISLIGGELQPAELDLFTGFGLNECPNPHFCTPILDEDTVFNSNNETQATNLDHPGTWIVSTSVPSVPEPASGTLLIAGLVGLAGLALKKSL